RARADRWPPPAAESAVCSPGLIGERLPMDLLLPGVDAAAKAASADGGLAAADAIRTPDTGPRPTRPDGPSYGIGGMAMRAALLGPALPTMLCVLPTDADLPAAELDR